MTAVDFLLIVTLMVVSVVVLARMLDAL